MSADLTETYQFTEVRMHTPYDNLAAAIGAIQSHILAIDTGFNAKVLFGPSYDFTQILNLQTALAMLVPLIDELESAKWGANA